MERDHRQPPAGRQAVERRIQRGGQTVELAVDGDAQCLEHAARRVTVAPGRRRDGVRHDVGKLQRRFDRAARPFAHDSARDGTRESFFTVAPKDLRKLLLRQAGDQIGRRFAALAHAHIQRCVVMIGKAALRRVELMRRHADIQQDPVHRRDAQRGQHRIHVDEIRLHQRGGQAGQSGTGGADRIGIPIERDQPAAGGQPLGDGGGMSAAAGRAVEIDPVRPNGKSLQRLAQQHRTVIAARAGIGPFVRHAAPLRSHRSRRISGQKPYLMNSSSSLSSVMSAISAA